jgi:hypothetical protein
VSEEFEVPTITIPLAEYLSLKGDAEWRAAAEAAGVDNWSGMEYVWQILDGEDPF